MANLTNAAGTVQTDVDAVHKALRVTAKPQDHGSNGHYAWGGFTGILPAAIAANSEIFQFRNAAATLCLIQRVKISACVSTTFFAAGVPVQIDLIRSTSWSVAGTGGTAVAPAALLRKRNTFANSVIASGDMRIATTAALGAGTKTLDTYALAAIAAPGPITASLNGQIIAPDTTLFESPISDGHYPLTLAQNEGFSIRAVAVPGTGTWTATVAVEWIEVASY